MSKIILTGDRPTGRLHIGHYVGSLRRRVELQTGPGREYKKFSSRPRLISNSASNNLFQHLQFLNFSTSFLHNRSYLHTFADPTTGDR